MNDSSRPSAGSREPKPEGRPRRAELDRWIAAADPAGETESPLVAEARVSRLMTTYRASLRGSAASADRGWRWSPASLRIAGAGALLVGLLGGMALPRIAGPEVRPAAALGSEDPWPSWSSPPALVQLYLADDESLGELDDEGGAEPENGVPTGEGRG